MFFLLGAISVLAFAVLLAGALRNRLLLKREWGRFSLPLALLLCCSGCGKNSGNPGAQMTSPRPVAPPTASAPKRQTLIRMVDGKPILTQPIEVIFAAGTEIKSTSQGNVLYSDV